MPWYPSFSLIARVVLRGVLPYPDLPRRIRVRRRARDLATRDPLPTDETAMTGLDYARLALLRSLWSQRETRRAVRGRQWEAAALSARTSMETCILGLWCLHHPDAATKLRPSEIRTTPAMLSFLSSTGIVPDAVIRQAVRELGEPRTLPPVRAMTKQIDAKPGAGLAIAHAGRVPPPMLAIIGKGLIRPLAVTDLIHTPKQARDLRVNLAGTRPDEAAAERQRRARDLYDTVLARLDLDLPPEALKPVVDYLVTKVLAEWDT